MGAYDVCMDEEAADFLAEAADGDARSALNAVELGVLTTERSADGKIHFTIDVASECIQKRVIRYDKAEIITTIRSLLLSRVCGDQIRMRQFIIWQECSMPEKV